MRRGRKRIIWISLDILLAAALTALDQFTKKLAVSKLMGREPFVILKGIFELDYLENKGSAFGMFQNQKVFLLCVSAVFLILMAYLWMRMPAEKKYLPMYIAVAGIVAGGLGNMIDRFRLGYVIDFFSFVLIHFPVFNVADICIVLSTILMAVLLLFVYREEDLAFLAWKRGKDVV